MSRVRAGADHGRHIFVYSNIQTGQTFYSLRREWDNTHAMRQITFVGKKSVPTEIRRDLWHPIATVSFPSGYQGLSAFKKLREYRKLHELCWEPEEGKTALPSRKERRRMLQDQKANSIADIAAVLHGQEKLSASLEQEYQQKKDKVDELEKKEWDRLQALHDLSKDGELDKVNEHIARLQGRYDRATSERRKALTKSGIMVLRKRKNELMRAYTAIKQRDGKWRPNSADGAEIVAEEDNTEGVATEEGTTITSTPPLFKQAPRPERKRGKDWQYIINPDLVPRMSLDGVRIEWANIMDAEIAESWPQAVRHDYMALRSARDYRYAASPPREQMSDEERLENVTLDGEAAEESAEAEETEEQGQEKGRVEGEEDKPKQEQEKEQDAKPSSPFSRLRGMFFGGQKASPSNRPEA